MYNLADAEKENEYSKFITNSIELRQFDDDVDDVDDDDVNKVKKYEHTRAHSHQRACYQKETLVIVTVVEHVKDEYLR